ncbi:MAG: hypothetical protein AAGF95_08920 [Chloroflexota bacterium]
MEPQPDTNKPLMSIGWIVATDERDEAVLAIYRQACQTLQQTLEGQFPQFRWEMPFICDRRHAKFGALEPLPLLELGVQEKLSHHWDYALVLVSNELVPRYRTTILGVPSSALEVAIMSSARLATERQAEQLAALALHMLGHVWGLEHDSLGPMVVPGEVDSLCLAPFSAQQQTEIVERLEEVADARLEEQPHRLGRFAFYWRTFWADPRGIVEDIWGYAPWKMPLQMERLTAAAAVSILVLLLAAEAWEVGVNVSLISLLLGVGVATIGSTFFLFFGQHLGDIARHVGWREQLVRTRIVVFSTLLLGMGALWLMLFLFSFIATLYIPQFVLSRWVDVPIDIFALLRYAAFLATVGVIAGALGGNLEEEDEIKATLFYDEET